ncbi:SdpI family protein [Lactiplantibacillus sp. WILCCON 0030]|uniref:SdpI family protein n=1 Tax=Lactiplantibacillus brownii TaxID=3069269 RepID=A0ABU1ACH0_9LACO|nr:SdpI family protein [Lactiplantibacillus brownii]MDQ7938015.1 SdpI family protein [Lactiplantibacillus brownii]
MATNNFGLAPGFLIILIIWVYQRVRMPKMRSLAGYMSRRAIKNEETWKFAQHFYAMFGIEIFTILLVGAVWGGLFNVRWLQSINLQAIALGLALILQNVATERELRHEFPENKPAKH